MTEFRARISRVQVKGGASVHIIEPRGNDIPARPRALATEIEHGEHGEVTSAVMALEADPFQVYGCGNIDGMRAIGLFTFGLHKLNAIVLEAADNERPR